MQVLYEADFDNEVPSWTIFDDGHSWYLFSSENPTQTENGQLAMHHPQPNDNINTGYILADRAPHHRPLSRPKPTITNLTSTWATAILDSLTFEINSLNNSYDMQSYTISGSGHVSGNFTTAYNDNYLIALVLYGGDTCIASMDNFKMWRYSGFRGIVNCSGSFAYTTLFVGMISTSITTTTFGTIIMRLEAWASKLPPTEAHVLSNETTMLTAKFFTARRPKIPHHRSHTR